jgi:ABC-type multidrug transport system fused ATPase/permease subunit
VLAALVLAGLAGFEAVMSLPLAAQTLGASRQAASRLFEVVDTRPAVVDPAVPLHRPAGSVELQFSNVSFHYPGTPVSALDGIDFSLEAGRRIAVVGPSGAGKSTLINLLLRFWLPRSGSIRWNGRDAAEYSQEDIRSLVAVISQRPFFFNDSLRNNLLLARPEATEEQLRDAARKAQIEEFIQGLPKGYETLIGERGMRLSGGERQRLAIARAVLKDAPLLLLDEPTANLDPLTERLILDHLYGLLEGRSLLLITHRLIGLDRMDEILVLDRGRIVERGSQADLLTRGGRYAALWTSQSRILEDGSSG